MKSRRWFATLPLAGMLIVGGALADPLHDAARKGDLDQVKQLIAAGANVNAKDKNGITPLHSAAVGNHREVAQALIASGADVNSKTNNGMAPLHLATFWGHAEMVALLKQHGAQE
ncbi:MAG: ankyrin repeat domain-containing protein [Acidiferrobacterales bacterium]